MASGTTSKFEFSGTTNTSAEYIFSYETIITGWAFPAGWATADVTFEISVDGGTTWLPVYTAGSSDTAAAPVTLYGTQASRFVAVAPSQMAWGTRIRLKSSVNQTNKTVVCTLQRVI